MLRPLDPAELTRLIKRLKYPVTSGWQSIVANIVAALVALVLVFVMFVAIVEIASVKTSDADADRAQTALFSLAMVALFTYAIVDWRLLPFLRMRPIIRALRDTPDRIELLSHSHTDRHIVIETATHQLVVKAKHDGPTLFNTLRRRCPSATIKWTDALPASTQRSVFP